LGAARLYTESILKFSIKGLLVFYAPQEGVLVERLKQQNDWLYENEEN